MKNCRREEPQGRQWEEGQGERGEIFQGEHGEIVKGGSGGGTETELEKEGE